MRTYEKREPRTAFCSEVEKVIGVGKKLQLEELYTSPKTVRITQIRRVGWAWHVARTERSEMHTQFQHENKNESYCSLDKSIEGVELLGAW